MVVDRFAARRGLAFLAAIGVAHCGFVGSASAATVIAITYDFVATQVSPKQKTVRKRDVRTYTLNGKTGNDFSGTGFQSNDAMTLGQEMERESQNGQKYKGVYKVLDGILFVVTDYGAYTTLRKIRTDGKKLFVHVGVQQESRLRTFEVDTPAHVAQYSDMHAENMTCSIVQTAD